MVEPPPPAPAEREPVMLRLVLPKGSLEAPDPPAVRRRRPRRRRAAPTSTTAAPSTTRASTRCAILRPQEIPQYVADGRFDVGITGRDWIEERNADVVTLTELHYSKATARPIQIVLAVAADSPATSVTDLPSGVVVHTEYPELTPPLLRQARRRRRRAALVRRHRGEGARHRRRGRRDHRDRPRAARRRAQDHRHRCSCRTPS